MSLHLDARPPYVRGEYGVTYEVSEGVSAVDRHLRAVCKNFGADHPDVDELLDARTILTRRTEKP